jgi:7,8-dihydropterin-6-yl-methyl-4-(beta-D-ribofuranosyl)aminobenzene 5'-phosphate synthase
MKRPLIELFVVIVALLLIAGACVPAALPLPTPEPPPSTPAPPTPTPMLSTSTPLPPSATPVPPTATSDLKLTILYDNTTTDSRLKSDWGFAALVEYGGHMLLFDTGANGPILLSNMQQLGVDPRAIEAVVLSHEHYDHTGGLQALLDAGYRPTVYVPSKFGDISKQQLRKQIQLVEVTDATEIFPGVHTTRPVGSTIEQALVAESREGTVVIVGCAHPGLVEMVRQAQQVVPGKIFLLAGGFHIPMIDDDMLAELRQLGVERVLPAHCTGDAAIAEFRTEYGENYIGGGVGRTVTASTVSRATLPASTPLPTAVSSEGAGDDQRVVQAYYAALNSGDVDAALAFFTDDVKFRGEYYATGKEALRGVFDWLVGTEVEYGPPDCQSQNDRVVCDFSIGDACIAASGATDGLPAQGEYLIQPDGKIREASESLGGAGWDDYVEWDNALQGWAILNRAEEWLGSGMSREFAPRLVKLCKEYAESLK